MVRNVAVVCVLFAAWVAAFATVLPAPVYPGQCCVKKGSSDCVPC